jgi:UDP-glucose 4-epimerase
MSILVTGGAGYIGGHMVHELVDDGEHVVVLDNLSTGFDWAVPNGVPLIVGDTGDPTLVGQIIREHKVDSIIHFAGSLVVPDSVKDPLGYYKNNTVNSRALIETAVKNAVRQFIFSSTCAVYGNPAQVPVSEDTPPAPISPYGWSKLMTEIMLRDAGRSAKLLSSYSLGYYCDAAGQWLKARGIQLLQILPVSFTAAIVAHFDVDYGSLVRWLYDFSCSLNCGPHGRQATDHWRELLRTRCVRGAMPAR